MSAGVEELLMRVAEVAGRKLTWWQYDQTSWSAREWMPFALQRLSVQLWMALADEAQRAIGAASRGREGPRGDAMPSLAYCTLQFETEFREQSKISNGTNTNRAHERKSQNQTVPFPPFNTIQATNRLMRLTPTGAFNGPKRRTENSANYCANDSRSTRKTAT